jgi:hypothetical protein
MDVNKLIKFFVSTGFLTESKMNRMDMDKVKQTLDLLYNPDISQIDKVFRHYESYEDFLANPFQRDCYEWSLKGHISRIHLWDGHWLCQHHAGEDGHGYKALAKMIRDSIVDNTEGIEYFCAYYQPSKPFPNALYGDVYREVNDKSLITETPYGYRYFSPDEVVGKKRTTIRAESVENDRVDSNIWPVKKLTFRQDLWDRGPRNFGKVYHNYSDAGINFSGYTNSSIFELNTPVMFDDIAHLIRPDVPTMWTPISYLIGAEPEKTYHFWKAKTDRRLWKYFAALQSFLK